MSEQRMALGLIGRKLGMTQIYGDDGSYIPVTVVKAGPCFVTQVKSLEKDGYRAVQIGFEEAKAGRLNRPRLGHLGELPPLTVLREFRLPAEGSFSLGDRLTVEQFEAGEMLAVTGTSKGKGFAGVMKRHGFRGGKRTHGQSDRPRHAGSIGAGTSPSRVFRGTRMAGRMGGERVTVKNIKVVGADPDRNLLLLEGAVPGPNGGVLLLGRVKR